MGIGGQQAKVLQIIATTSNFSDQIDAIATVQHWCKSGWRWDQDTSAHNHWQTDRIFESYISGLMSVRQAVDQLSIPIETAYIAALNGEPVTESGDTAGFDAASGLWDLWWGVFHAARKAPWDLPSNKDQPKLLELIQQIQARPDPISLDTPLPPTLQNDFVYSDRRLWSNLTLIGPAVRELWDDSPGCGSGVTEPEVKAWLNVNAFAARLTISGIRDFWTYGIWAMRDAVEGRACRTTGAVDVKDDKIAFRVAYVWLKVAGREMWESCCEGSEREEVEVPMDVDVCGKKCPWFGNEKPDFLRSRWRYWCGRFELVCLSKNREWSDGSKAMALEATMLMRQIDGTA